MFRKLHLQLTIFCTLVTGAILLAMTCICLTILHADASRREFISFEKNAASTISYLESQTVISHPWLLRSEQNYHLKIFISEGEAPLFFNSLDHSEETLALFEKARKKADLKEKNRKVTETVTFSLEDGPGYHAAVSIIPRDTDALHVVTLYSLKDAKAARTRQDLLFFTAAAAAVALLAVFSWCFTRRMLLPIQESRRRQTGFVASASHELRAPLTVILASLTAMEDAPEDKRQQFAANIREEGHRMERLISDMLALASADNGSWSICPAEIYPDTFLLEMYERYLPRAREKKIRLDIRLPEDAVQPRRWDTDRMAQVLGILLDNALSYTPAGGHIRLILSQKREKIQIQVTDNGPGIPDGEKEAVFRRFYRIDQARHDREHFGLGLCIAKEIVRLHRGQIHVGDTPGGGACFTITL